KVQVHVRVKPTNNFSTDHLELNLNSEQISVHLPKHVTRGHIDNQQLDFSFCVDKLFHNASQEEVYNESAHKMVLRALDGYSGTLLAFGQTGAGKTYTITGPPDSYRHRD
ncbi:hypothetical protein, partial [Salmonella sp. s51228]|uniref:hypothetical protein n=1 Tax=Salmonella sp. s51228 TaxID=3159652 RepID=UPI0039814301